jgi:nicotinamide riboside kinase
MLAEGLARHFKTTWVKEYAREYLEKLDRHYEQDDLLKIAHGQLASEESLLQQAHNFLFCDTEFLVLFIWSMDKYGSCNTWITEKLMGHRYDLFLLCDIDMPWQPDPLREDPDRRELLFNRYKQELTDRKLPFVLIKGVGDERLKNAIYNINNRFGR